LRSHLRSRKIFLILTKFTPHLIGLIYIIYTASLALEFCYVHRLPLYYVAIDEILLVTDQYYGIPLNVYNLFLLHLTVIGILIFSYTYYYVKYHKKNTTIVH